MPAPFLRAHHPGARAHALIVSDHHRRAPLLLGRAPRARRCAPQQHSYNAALQRRSRSSPSSEAQNFVMIVVRRPYPRNNNSSALGALVVATHAGDGGTLSESVAVVPAFPPETLLAVNRFSTYRFPPAATTEMAWMLSVRRRAAQHCLTTTGTLLLPRCC